MGEQRWWRDCWHTFSLLGVVMTCDHLHLICLQASPFWGWLTWWFSHHRPCKCNLASVCFPKTFNFHRVVASTLDGPAMARPVFTSHWFTYAIRTFSRGKFCYGYSKVPLRLVYIFGFIMTVPGIWPFVILVFPLSRWGSWKFQQAFSFLLDLVSGRTQLLLLRFTRKVLRTKGLWRVLSHFRCIN